MKMLARLLAAFLTLASPAFAGTIYIDTGGSATNSGSTDGNTATVSGSAATQVTTVITLDGLPNLSATVTAAGATQSSIYLTGSTVTNKKIFWITAFDDTANTVTVDADPTCAANACGAWAIGGRVILTNASQEGALRAGDVAIFNNSPAAQAAALWTFRIAGDATSGYAKIKGKVGTRPTLNATSTTTAIITGSLANTWIENLIIDQDGATGGCITNVTLGSIVYNVQIIDCGTTGGVTTVNGAKIIASDISGSAGSGIVSTSTGTINIVGNYIHGNVEGIHGNTATPNFNIINNIIAANSGRGIYLSGAATTQAHLALISGNTIYANGNSGLEVVDTDTHVVLMNNIFQDNGNAGGEYNVEWLAGTAELIGFHGWNTFYDNAAGDNLSNLTVDAQVAASEITTDPLLTNPGSGDFTLSSTSPALIIGYPGQLLGAGLGYKDLGALQRQPPAASGSGMCLGC